MRVGSAHVFRSWGAIAYGSPAARCDIGPAGNLGVTSGGCPTPHLGLWRLALIRTLPASPCVDARHRTEGGAKAYDTPGLLTLSNPVLYHGVHPLGYVCTSQYIPLEILNRVGGEAADREAARLRTAGS